MKVFEDTEMFPSFRQFFTLLDVKRSEPGGEGGWTQKHMLFSVCFHMVAEVPLPPPVPLLLTSS